MVSIYQKLMGTEWTIAGNESPKMSFTPVGQSTPYLGSVGLITDLSAI